VAFKKPVTPIDKVKKNILVVPNYSCENFEVGMLLEILSAKELYFLN
jgi:hypothetical protein